MKRLDIIGERYGRLVVTGYAPSIRMTLSSGKTAYISRVSCRCDCGKTVVVRTGHLVRGATRSCGCLKTDLGHERITHGECRDHRVSRLYRAWTNMRRRCNKASSLDYKRYGGRGIRVCPQWDSSFGNFRDWAMENGYADNLEIDRIDNDGDYCPENCRWVDRKTQMNNTSTNRYITALGQEHTLSEWCRITGLSHECIRQRLDVKGWNPDEAMLIPLLEGGGGRNYSEKERNCIMDAVRNGIEIHSRPLELYGMVRGLDEWCRLFGIPRRVFKDRRLKGWSPEEAILLPYVKGRRRRYSQSEKERVMAERWAAVIGG